MTFARVSPIEGGWVHDEVARVEGSSELFQRELLAGALRPLEEDDGPAPVGNLWQLEFGEMFAQGAKRRRKIRPAPGKTDFALDHETGS
jgi:hypothetical protein